MPTIVHPALAWLLGKADGSLPIVADPSPDDDEEGDVTASWEDRTVNLFEEAARATYANGKSKRDRYPRVDLGARKVVIVLHQTGFRWSNTNRKLAEITAHDVIQPDGTIFRLHPVDVQLVGANRLNREPYHALNIEVMGNLEGVDGSGRWYRPEVFGRHRATEAQVLSARYAVHRLVEEIDRFGGAVRAIVPHRCVGYNATTGKPDRQIDPGSRVWSEVGEWAGAVLGLAVPGPTWRINGLPIPPEWRGRFYPSCAFRLGEGGLTL